MNILIFSWRGPGHPNAGGAEISTHEHAKGWVRAGHKVTLFTSLYKGAKKEEIIDGVKIIRSGSQTFGVQVNAFKWYLFDSHEKFDLVVDQFHGIPFFTPLFVKTKKLAFIHEVVKEVWKHNEFSFPFNFLVAFLGKVLEPWIFKLYKKIPFMTVSGSTKNDLTDWGIPQQNITVIHNGVSVPEISLKKENIKTIIYLGALTKDKGVEMALQCFKKIEEEFTGPIQFWVIGKGSQKYTGFLKSKASLLNLKKIKFWGYVNEIEKFKLLSRSHILINPSVKEGWGLVVIEAAALGVPTIAFNVSGLRDSILDEKTGLLSKEFTAQSLAKEAFDLLNNQSKMEQMSKNAKNWSQNFSWDKSSTLSLKLIKQVTG